MLALIDADICLHRVGFTTENEEFFIAKARFDEMIDKILISTKSDEYQLWLSDNKESNFRYKIWDQYKANRVAPKPKWFEELKEYAITEWGAKIAHGMEGDDALGIEQMKHTHKLPFGQAHLKSEGSWYNDDFYGNSVICSIDKDLLQIPGRHFNFVKEEDSFITPEEGLKSFYTSLLVGDVSDNIPGAPGIGPVKAAKALIGITCGGINDERELWDKVAETYVAAWQKKGLQPNWKQVIISAQLLKIRQQEDEPLWQAPSQKFAQTAVNGLSSTQQTGEDTDQSTELTGLASLMGGSLLNGIEMGQE